MAVHWGIWVVGVYPKFRTYKMPRESKNDSNLPWLMGEDLNEISYNYEKTGWAIKNKNLLQVFCDAAEECGL